MYGSRRSSFPEQLTINGSLVKNRPVSLREDRSVLLLCPYKKLHLSLEIMTYDIFSSDAECCII